MKRRLFRRVFILYFVALLVSAVFMHFYLTSVIRSSYIKELTRSMSTQALMIAGVISSGGVADLNEFTGTTKQDTGLRMTILDATGRVLGDSDNDPSTMDNHINRPEIQQAIVSGTGWSIRFSDTLKYDLLYVVTKIVQSGEHKGFVRLAVPLKKVNESINTLRLKINLAAITVFLLFGLVLIYQTERIRKFVMKISEYAGALAHGLFKKRLYLEGAGEFTELAHSLNNMAMELEETIKTGDEEAKRLNVILRSIPDALLLINVHNIIEISNNAARDLFGSEKLDGRPFLEVVRSPVFIALMDEVKKNRLPGAAELTFDLAGERFLYVRVSPLYYQVGELAGFVAIFHDTTQMKKLEQMRKDFVANVSHEIKTPITSIKGFAETLLDGALYDKENAERFLTTIKTHSERLNRLVEDLLIISRLELGVMTVNKTEFHVTDIIDEVMQISIVRAAEKNLSIKKSVDQGEALINADRDRLTQILLNLTDNAVKFTDKGEIEIGLDREDGRHYFYVRDTGPGVPQKYLSRLGERFFRVDPSRSRELGGTGLGLAIVKHLVKAHGWEMKIESEEGKGTTVKVFY
ncbi:MAG: PAS domain S-box protein [Nitrospirae bacterium]|nr:PAS domain S-box protein [Nitrospirota bacterium]